MKFETGRIFDKKYLKLGNKIRSKFRERRDLFENEPASRILNLHKLEGKFENLWSINITGDYRAIFYYKDNKQTAVFVNIGTHSELFG
jgi:addiction module RelE/StbE family toxin